MHATPQTDALRITLDDGDAIPVFAHWLGPWRVSVYRRTLSAAELARSYDRVAPTWERTIARLDYPSAYEFLLGRRPRPGSSKSACRIRVACLPTAPGSSGA